MSGSTRILLRVYGVVGLLGVGFAAFYAFVVAKASRGGPGDIGLAVAAGVLLLAQAGPAAGLLVLAWHRRADRPWPRSTTVALGAVAAVLVLAGLFVGAAPLLLVLVTAASGAFVARRLARMHRRWVVAWLVYSAACLAVDAFALWFWFAVLGAPRG